MGAIFGIVGVLILVLLIAVLWMMGALRPKSRDKSGLSAQAATEKPGRTNGLD